MAKTHLVALENKYDWIMVGIVLIGGIIPETLGCKVDYPEDTFPIIRERQIRKISDIDKISSCNSYIAKMKEFNRFPRLYRRGTHVNRLPSVPICREMALIPTFTDGEFSLN